MARLFFFFNDTATAEIYTLSLHDALPICGDLTGLEFAPAHRANRIRHLLEEAGSGLDADTMQRVHIDRKSTRLNSSHANISYAVFCLKKTERRGSKPWALFVSLVCPHFPL